MAGFETRGMDELLAMLGAMDTGAKKVQDQALTKAAEPILADMLADAPVLTGKGRAGLKIGKPETKNGARFIRVGVTKADSSEIFYLKFSEWGTSKQPAKPFMQPALEKNIGVVKGIILEELRKGLGL